jgi:tRNA G26 N,N-dimethylase Trm1
MKRRLARTLESVALATLLAASVCGFSMTAVAAVPVGARAIRANAEMSKAFLILADNSSTATSSTTSNGKKGQGGGYGKKPPPPPPPVCKPPPVSCHR